MRSTEKKHSRIRPIGGILAALLCVAFLAGSALSEEVTDDSGVTLIDSAYQSGYTLSTSSPSASSGLTPCEGNNYANDDYVDGTSMGGPMVAISWIPLSSVTIARIEVFTGEHEGPNALAIWSDDGDTLSSKPVAPLGYSDSFTSVPTNCWQGADLITQVSVTAGMKYWVVWDPEGGEQASLNDDPADIQQTYWGSYKGTVSGGADWFGPFSSPTHRWKFRMFCGEMVVEVDIDIKPGSYPNAINLGSHGLIPIAILSSEDFDATSVNPDTVELAGVGVAVRGKSSKYMAHEEDVNGDGLVDLMLQVPTANFDPNSLQDGAAILTGQTYSGEDVQGMDEVTIVP